MPRGISQIDDSARQNPAYSSSHSIIRKTRRMAGFLLVMLNFLTMAATIDTIRGRGYVGAGLIIIL